MTNSYRVYLDQFWEKLQYYRHTSYLLNELYENEIQETKSEKVKKFLFTNLAISDWTGATENDWEKYFPVGISKETTTANYSSEMEKIFSKQLCLLYAQSFESFERFLKDCLYDRLGRDDTIRKYVIKKLPKNTKLPITREKMPGGDKLYNVLKKAGGETYRNFNSKNNLNIKYKELWTILSEVRHSITHNESMIQTSIIQKSDHHSGIFNYLFNSKDVSSDVLLIELDQKKFDTLIKRFSEFAFQVFKILSIEEDLEWKNKE